MSDKSESMVVRRVGYWSALVAFIGAAGYGVVQVLQLAGVLRPPLDGILIFGFSLVIATPFMIALVALHHDTPPKQRFWTHTALLMSVIYVTYVTLNYVVQLAVVIPRLTIPSSITVLDQTPHSLFWTIDALGYLFLGAATLLAAPALKGSASNRWVRTFFLANAFMTPVIGLVYFFPRFSVPLLLLGTPWLITAPGSFLLLALMFRRRLRRIQLSAASRLSAPLTNTARG